MSQQIRMSRRTVLRGLGTAVALPWLEAMLPLQALAGTTARAPGVPLRMAFVYVPNGVHMQTWRPAEVGSEYKLPETLEPLSQVRGDFSILTGLSHKRAEANGDGPGDHARALATFLTGKQARKTHGADIRAGVSVDQIAAKEIGQLTRFSSLELGCDHSQLAGNCDSGYSCAYSGNISWKSETMPLAKEVNPRLLFERLFSVGRPDESAAARAKRARYNKSVLDLVLEDAQSLKTKLGSTDQRKLDEYLTAVRELEVRIARTDDSNAKDNPALATKPTGIPATYEEHIRLMFDLLVLAFQGDVTRVSTFVLANEGSNKSYPFLGVPEGHHDISHHGNDEKKHDKLKKINRFHVTQFAYFLEKLKSIPEGAGNLLDNSLIVYGSGIGDGNRHNHDDLPILLAGKAGGAIKPGRHLKYKNRTPLSNLYVTALDRFGVNVKSFGDSDGRLEDLG